MNLFIDLNTNRVTFGSIAGVASGEEVKIRQTEDVRLQFHRSGVLELIGASDALYLGLKADRGAAATLAEQSTWSHPGSTAGFYTCALSLNTTNIVALFDTYSTQDKISVPLEITRTPSGGATRRYDDVFVTLVRSVFTGTEIQPTAGPYQVTLILNGAGSAYEAFENGVSKGFIHLFTTAP
jgi:hypothetical protein